MQRQRTLDGVVLVPDFPSICVSQKDGSTTCLVLYNAEPAGVMLQGSPALPRVSADAGKFTSNLSFACDSWVYSERLLVRTGVHDADADACRHRAGDQGRRGQAPGGDGGRDCLIWVDLQIKCRLRFTRHPPSPPPLLPRTLSLPRSLFPLALDVASLSREGFIISLAGAPPLPSFRIGVACCCDLRCPTRVDRTCPGQ